MSNEANKASTKSSTLITLAFLAVGVAVGFVQLFAGFQHEVLHSGAFFFAYYPLAIVVTVLVAAFNNGTTLGRWTMRVALFCIAAEVTMFLSFAGLFAGVH